MKAVKILILLIIICSFSVISLEVPDESDTRIISQVAQEHQNTRKFLSDELVRQRNEFFKEVDSRADYYERTVESMLTTTVFKLALLWGGIMFFFVSFNNFIRNRLEKKRYKRLKENIIEEIVRDPNYNPYPVAQQNPIIDNQKGYGVVADRVIAPSQNNLQQPQPNYSPQPHISQMSKRKQKRAMKQLRKVNKAYEFYALEKAKVETKLGIYEKPQQQQQQQRGIPIPPAPTVEIPQPPPPPPPPQADPEPEKTEYKYDFEVNY